MSRALRLLGVVLTVALVACGDEPTKPAGDQPFEGTYDLTRVNGAPLPYTTSLNGVTFRLNSAVLVMRADSTYTLDASATVFGGSYPIHNDGTYVRAENAVTFPVTIEGVPYEASGTVSAGVLTMNFDDPGSPVQSMTLRRRRG